MEDSTYHNRSHLPTTNLQGNLILDKLRKVDFAQYNFSYAAPVVNQPSIKFDSSLPASAFQRMDQLMSQVQQQPQVKNFIKFGRSLAVRRQRSNASTNISK